MVRKTSCSRKTSRPGVTPELRRPEEPHKETGGDKERGRERGREGRATSSLISLPLSISFLAIPHILNRRLKSVKKKTIGKLDQNDV